MRIHVNFEGVNRLPWKFRLALIWAILRGRSEPLPRTAVQEYPIDGSGAPERPWEPVGDEMGGPLE